MVGVNNGFDSAIKVDETAFSCYSRSPLNTSRLYRTLKRATATLATLTGATALAFFTGGVAHKLIADYKIQTPQEIVQSAVETAQNTKPAQFAAIPAQLAPAPVKLSPTPPIVTLHQAYRPTITTTQATSSRFVRSANNFEERNSALLASLPIKLRPGTDHRADSSSTPLSQQRCQSLVYRGLQALPKSHRDQLEELTLFYTNDGRRGLGGEHSIVLRCLNVTDTELVGVLTHEVGHLVDNTLLTGHASNITSGFYDFDTPVAADDMSLRFYRLSWESDKKRIAATSEPDFVSTYAMTDPFEDFAETYAYYRLHGQEFRSLRPSSDVLTQKYEFMKNYVFNGVEFGDTTHEVKVDMWTRDYDVTVLPYALKNILG